MSRQLRLNLQRDPERSRERFIVSESNRDALVLLDSPELWNGGVLALVGPEGCGKTHLATAWAAETHALVYEPARPMRGQLGRAANRPVLWDDADRAEKHDEALFHLINIAARGGRLLLTGRTSPRAWPTALPDLRSRLNALTVAEMAPPDDTVMAGLLAKFFRERNIRPAEDVVPYLLRRMERSGPAAAALVSRLDEEGRPVTRALARQVLAPGDETSDDD